MLLLASTSDLIRVITSSTANIDVHASYVDGISSIVPGRTNTTISTATTTTVVASPGSGVYRTVKTLTVRNRHASTSNTITLVHTDGTNAMEIIQCVLAAGESLMYVEGAGFWQTDIYGRAKVANYGNVGAATGSGLTTVVLASDQTNNNGTANTIADVTGLSFSVVAGSLYYFDFHIVYTAAATTTGSRWSINGPSSPTYLDYRSEYSLTTTTSTRNAMLQAYDAPASSNATSAATGNNWANITGVIQPSANGTLVARFASEVASSAIVAKAGSFVNYQQIT
jgi:hypothetical protein